MKTEIKTEINKDGKSVIKWIIAASFVFALVSCSQIAIAAEITARKMIELTNESREKSELPPLTINGKLTAAAEAKADDMFRFQYFDHNSPSGVTPWHWIKSAGYDYIYAGENLAIDFVTAEGTHMALMRSITHRDNILKPNYTEIGIAVKRGIFNGNESIIIVEEFGAPMKKENNEIRVDVMGDADVDKQESKIEIKTEETKKELIEIRSPIVYLKNEDNGEIEKIERIAIKENGIELVLPTLFPVENIKLLDEIYTEDIFWNGYEEKGAVDNLKAMVNDYFSFLNIWK
jgi:hypothetical protein